MKKLLSVGLVLLLVACVGTAQAEPRTAVLTWSPPVERENGDPITVGELGGYEIQVYLAGAGEYTTVVVPDGAATNYRISDLPSGEHTFRIAVFDTNGLYSDFVAINYQQSGAPGRPLDVSVGGVKHDVIAACLAEGPPRCRVAVAGEW